MKIDLQALSEAVVGKKECEIKDGELVIHRFTKRQEDYYARTNRDFYVRALCNASVRIDFTTDAREMSFSYRAMKMSSRKWYYFDVYENDVLVMHVGNDDAEEDSGEIRLALGEGEKRIRIYLPSVFAIYVSEFMLEGGRVFLPTVNGGMRAVIYGDSITHGYDAKYPSLSYANILIDELGLNAINQAIGGEKFNPEIIDAELCPEAELVTVAYGTNDWGAYTAAVAAELADKFFKGLKTAHPCAKILYISPIWRADHARDDKRGGEFTAFIAMLERVAANNGAAVVHGLDLLPHDGGMLSDGLHPNDLGFTQYAAGLIREMRGLGVIER